MSRAPTTTTPRPPFSPTLRLASGGLKSRLAGLASAPLAVGGPGAAASEPTARAPGVAGSATSSGGGAGAAEAGGATGRFCGVAPAPGEGLGAAGAVRVGVGAGGDAGPHRPGRAPSTFGTSDVPTP